MSRFHREIDEEVRKLLYQALGSMCKICDETINLEIDHIIPMCLGGKNILSNVQLLCSKCHKYKNRLDGSRRKFSMYHCRCISCKTDKVLKGIKSKKGRPLKNQEEKEV